MLDHEAGLVVARDGLGREARGGAGAARPAGKKLKELLGVDVALLGEGEGVGIAHHAGGEAHLVAELGRLARARLVEVEELLAEGGEHGHHGRGVLLPAAEDQGEGTRLGARLAARDGAVEGVDVGHLGRVVDVARELSGAGGEVDEVGALLRGAQDAVGGQVDVLDVGRVPHHGEDHVGALRGLAGGLCPLGAAGEKPLGLGLRAGVHGEVEAGVQDVARDGGAHDARADERDLGVLVAQLMPFG